MMHFLPILSRKVGIHSVEFFQKVSIFFIKFLVKMNIFSAKNFAESRYFCEKPVYKNIDFLRKKFRLSAKFLAPPTPKTNREPCAG
jgi:hypothetical protein